MSKRAVAAMIVTLGLVLGATSGVASAKASKGWKLSFTGGVEGTAEGGKTVCVIEKLPEGKQLTVNLSDFRVGQSEGPYSFGVVFEAPYKAGTFDLRAVDGDGPAYSTFENQGADVQASWASTPPGTATLKRDKLSGSVDSDLEPLGGEGLTTVHVKGSFVCGKVLV
jgi:hypothetical protein